MNRLAFPKSATRHSGNLFALLFGLTALIHTGVTFAQSLTGQVDYARLYALNVAVGGEVAAVSVNVGDRVKAGTLLLSMDDADLKSALAAAAADMAWKQALADEAERAWERDNELYAEGSLSQVELDLSNISRLQALAEFRRTAAAHAVADSRIKRSRILAPASGVVLEVSTFPGDRINLETDAGPLLVMGSATLVVRAHADGSGVIAPAVGQQARIVSGEQELNGVVISSIPAADGPGVVVTVQSDNLLPPAGTPVEIRF